MSSNSHLRKMDRARTLGLSPEDLFEQDDEQKLDQLYYNKLKEPQKPKCSNCPGTNLQESDDQIVCQDCFSIQIHIKQEIGNDLYQDDQSYQYISKEQADLYGNSYQGGTSTVYIKNNSSLTTLQKRQSLPPYQELEFKKNMDYIDLKSNQYGISQCINQNTKLLFKKVYHLDRHKGKKRIQQIAACFFLVCQQFEVTRTRDEVANMFSDRYQLKPKDICNGIKQIPTEFQQTSVSTATQFLYRFNNHLKLNNLAIQQTLQLLLDLQDSDLSTEFTPQHMCLSAMFYICKEYNYKTEKEFCNQIKKSNNHISISHVTLNKQKQKIQHFLDLKKS